MTNSPGAQSSRRQFIQSGVLAAAGAGQSFYRLNSGAKRNLDQNYLPSAERCMDRILRRDELSNRA
jgi:hypothetical protein